MHKSHLLLQYCSVTALKYYHYKTVANLIAHGDTLLLKREPDNKFDDLAVAVHLDNVEQTKIGFIPRSCNQALSNLMDAGCKAHFEVYLHVQDEETLEGTVLLEWPPQELQLEDDDEPLTDEAGSDQMVDPSQMP